MSHVLFALALLCPGRNASAEAIERAAEKYAIDPVALVVLMADESTCNPKAVNRRTGAVGLFQILPAGSANPATLTTERLHDPDTNVDLGAAAISRLLAICGSLGDALTLYRGGGKKDPDSGRTRCQTDAHSRMLLKKIRWVKQKFGEQIKRVSVLATRTSAA